MAGRYELLSSRGSRTQEEERLPEGMQRIGYDSDTQTYTFRDGSDGTLWESEPGAMYGRLHRAGVAPAAADDAMLEQAKKEDWRYMAPFFLLVMLVLLTVWRFFGPPIFSSPSSALRCPGGSEAYRVEKGDTCWGIAQRAGSSVEALKGLNEGLRCEGLRPGMRVCVSASGGGG